MALERLTGSRAFYPAAALYAALGLPASVLAMPAGWSPRWHAHEMLFGFALAAVAGNQLGALSGWRLGVLLAAWLGARAAFFASPGGLAAAIANAAFAALLAGLVAPRLLGAAKKLRNQALPAVLVALCASAIAFHFVFYPLSAVVLLLATLMLFMGGRIIVPGVAGQLERQGIRLAARVQPRIEGAILVAMGLAVIASFFRLHLMVAALCLVAGILAAIRLARWRLWALRGRPDLFCLASGYAWLALGLAAFGAAAAIGRLQSEALHLITVGALGTLTFNVMAMSWLAKARRDRARSVIIVWGTALVAAATLLRVAGALEAAALCWSAAYALLLALFLIHIKVPPRRGRTIPK